MGKELYRHEVPDYFNLAYACSTCILKFKLTVLKTSNIFNNKGPTYCAICGEPTDPTFVREYIAGVN